MSGTPSEPPEWAFDDVLAGTLDDLLVAMGITGGGVAALITVAFIIRSWIDGLRSTVEIGVQGYRAAERTVRGLGSAGVLMAGAVTAPVLAAELLALGLVYILGNFLSVFVELVRTNGNLSESPSAMSKLQKFEQAWETEGVVGWLRLPLSGGLDLDVPVALTLLVAVLGMLGALRGGDGDRNLQSTVWWGAVIAFPVSLWLALVAPFLLVALVIRTLFLGEFSTGAPPEVVDMLIISGLYCAIMAIAAAGLQIVGAVWKRQRS